MFPIREPASQPLTMDLAARMPGSLNASDHR